LNFLKQHQDSLELLLIPVLQECLLLPFCSSFQELIVAN
jgi:hypothetical protein